MFASWPGAAMTKRKFIKEDDEGDRYSDAECPDCGAIINARFHPGRDWRRLHCPVCRNQVTVSIRKTEETPLIQLQRDAE